MENKIVVITGAGSGLGASLAKKYSELGACVVLLGRTKEKLMRTAKALKNTNFIYEVDVSVNEEVEKVFEAINKEIGDIDILINNAGVGSFDFVEDIDEKSIHDMIDINLKGTIFCTQAVLKQMKMRNHGYIINIISKSGKRPKMHESVYCASKFGMRGFAETLAIELEDTPIRVTNVYMGNMNTEFWSDPNQPEKKERFIDPDDMADIIIANTKTRKHLTVEEIVVKNI